MSSLWEKEKIAIEMGFICFDLQEFFFLFSQRKQVWSTRRLESKTPSFNSTHILPIQRDGSLVCKLKRYYSGTSI